MITDIRFQLYLAGISLLSIEPEECNICIILYFILLHFNYILIKFTILNILLLYIVQTEPIVFITSSKENCFLSVMMNQNTPENNDPNAFLNEFLDNHSTNDYGKFWFKERSLKQSVIINNIIIIIYF